MSLPDRLEFDRIIRRRRSVRGFTPKPISDALMRRVFTLATCAPSNCNVQPWVVHVVSGASAERMRTLLREHASSGHPLDPDFPLTGAYPDVYRTRQIDAARALFRSTGVERDNLPGRRASFLRNFEFFGAPHAAFLFVPEWAGVREAMDCGMYAQSLMLAMAADGIASCAQGALGHYAGVVRRELGVGHDLRLLCGIAFGYEAADHPANATRTERALLSETTIFHT